MKIKESKIPDLTTELAQRVEANADALAAIGVRINSRMNEIAIRGNQ